MKTTHQKYWTHCKPLLHKERTHTAPRHLSWLPNPFHQSCQAFCVEKVEWTGTGLEALVRFQQIGAVHRIHDTDNTLAKLTSQAKSVAIVEKEQIIKSHTIITHTTVVLCKYNSNESRYLHNKQLHFFSIRQFTIKATHDLGNNRVSLW